MGHPGAAETGGQRAIVGSTDYDAHRLDPIVGRRYRPEVPLGSAGATRLHRPLAVGRGAPNMRSCWPCRHASRQDAPVADWILSPTIDARAVGLGPADLIFVFGTRLEAPAVLAADLFIRGLAPLVVVTGGTSRQADGLNEARHHLELLTIRGVPRDAVIVEDRSANTSENVLFALPLVHARCGDP